MLLPIVVIILVVAAGLWMLRAWITPTAVTVSAIGEGSGVSPDTGPAEMRVGAVLPEFKLRDFKSGSDLTVSSLKAKVALVNFWATWCEACMIEMPSIINVYQDFKSRGFEVVAVNLDVNAPAVVPRAVQKYGMPFPIYLDVNSRLADFFNIQAIPLSIVIDSNRKILMIENEGIDWNGAGFRKKLEEWLAK